LPDDNNYKYPFEPSVVDNTRRQSRPRDRSLKNGQSPYRRIFDRESDVEIP
jgi:hypothetical protein